MMGVEMEKPSGKLGNNRTDIYTKESECIQDMHSSIFQKEPVQQPQNGRLAAPVFPHDCETLSTSGTIQTVEREKEKIKCKRKTMRAIAGALKGVMESRDSPLPFPHRRIGTAAAPASAYDRENL